MASWQGFGYGIVKALVTDIIPDPKVKAAMNDINAARREQEAANARGEAEKILKVKQAEAEAQSKRFKDRASPISVKPSSTACANRSRPSRRALRARRPRT